MTKEKIKRHADLICNLAGYWDHLTESMNDRTIFEQNINLIKYIEQTASEWRDAMQEKVLQDKSIEESDKLNKFQELLKSENYIKMKNIVEYASHLQHTYKMLNSLKNKRTSENIELRKELFKIKK